ncbi:gasdermin-D [Pelodiscus sinensis]|uniref:gasdermin-D n=1 Tax=Pelodiscus sinensis TaxID=13735 RepID=UPI003F6D3526
MFQQVAKKLTQELDSDRRLIPVSSLAGASRYRPLCLVTREQSRWRSFQSIKYLVTPYTLEDVLKEGTSMDAEVQYEDLLQYSETLDQKAEAMLSLKSAPTDVDCGGSGKSSFSVSTVSVRRAQVVKKGQWKIDTSHDFIKELAGSHQRQLFVVTEAFDIKEALLIETMAKGKVKVMVQVGDVCGIQGRGKSIKKKTMWIPQGTVLAYVVQRLPIQMEGIHPAHKILQTSESSFVQDGSHQVAASLLTAFQNVKGTVTKECEQLRYLSQDFRSRLLGTFESLLQDGDLISTAKTALELSLAGGQPKPSMLDSLDETLQPQIEKLLHNLGVFNEGEGEEAHSLWRSVHFLCSSLEDLDFGVLPLLRTCLEKNMVAKQLELMDGIMEWILSDDEESIFSLAGSLTEEEKNMIAEMLHACGLIPQTDKPSLTCLWNKAAQPNLTALYAALYAFWTLSE